MSPSGSMYSNVYNPQALDTMSDAQSNFMLSNEKAFVNNNAFQDDDDVDSIF